MEPVRLQRDVRGVPRLIVALISSALTCFFALAGALTGAITGALAGRASACGVVRGAGLGAIAGAVLSIEVLEASRAYWCLEQSGARGSSSMADFVEELFRGRLSDGQLMPEMLTAYPLQGQVSLASMGYDVMHDVYGEVPSGGLSADSLKKLPCHVIDHNDTRPLNSNCCTICLQDIEIGEIARSLPKCLHMFHLTCVDRWLVGHGSCPVCRQDV